MTNLAQLLQCIHTYFTSSHPKHRSSPSSTHASKNLAERAGSTATHLAKERGKVFWSYGGIRQLWQDIHSTGAYQVQSWREEDNTIRMRPERSYLLSNLHIWMKWFLFLFGKLGAVESLKVHWKNRLCHQAVSWQSMWKESCLPAPGLLEGSLNCCFHPTVWKRDPAATLESLNDWLAHSTRHHLWLQAVEQGLLSVVSYLCTSRSHLPWSGCCR